jgi:hypothetical protein
VRPVQEINRKSAPLRSERDGAIDGRRGPDAQKKIYHDRTRNLYEKKGNSDKTTEISRTFWFIRTDFVGHFCLVILSLHELERQIDTNACFGARVAESGPYCPDPVFRHQNGALRLTNLKDYKWSG